MLIHAFNWKKLSVAMAVGFRWDFRRSALFFQTRPNSYNDVTLIEFLNDLKRERRGRRTILIWDGLPSHKSGPMQAYLRAHAPGSRWSPCPVMRRTSTRSSSCGAPSRGTNSPTSAPTISGRSSGSCVPAFAVSVALPHWPSRFSDMPDFLFDLGVTVLCESQ